jgi:hypothetical protein
MSNERICRIEGIPERTSESLGEGRIPTQSVKAWPGALRGGGLPADDPGRSECFQAEAG